MKATIIIDIEELPAPQVIHLIRLVDATIGLEMEEFKDNKRPVAEWNAGAHDSNNGEAIKAD